MERWADLAEAGSGPSRREAVDVASAAGDLRAVIHGDLADPAGAVVLCPPWGDEGARLRAWSSMFGDEAADRGLAVLRFAWPGSFHSGGDLRDTTFSTLADAVRAAADLLRSRSARPPLILVGVRLGCAALALALHAGLSADGVVLVQPVLDGAAHLEDRLRARSAVTTPADPTIAGWVWGEPWPVALRRDVTTQARAALDGARVPTTVVRYRRSPVALPAAQQVLVPGVWHQDPRLGHRRLRRATVGATTAMGR